MLSKAKYWMGIGKPKSQHSLENLKYLFVILNKNQIVTENNKDLLIETLRSISEILIWGDQNDSSVFDFFLEKQMITFFLHYMKQKYGRYICVQLLQTLNILFENIRNETSLYFLLSNNHINNIILNKFDFSDEEVMAYYISFLKTLSLKLNSHSIHFFFNERASEFPLYVEAIKFFDHPEAMVRIAVRTLTLNVFRVPVQSMQKFVKDKTATCYFANLVWLIRNHVLDLDICVKNTTDHTKKCRLTDLIDEYIDHLNYIQDIYMLNIQSLSNILTDQLIRRLFVPVYLSSILNKDKFIIKDRRPIITPILATFLLSHVFSIITYGPLLSDLCELVFSVPDPGVFDQMCAKSTSGIDYLIEPTPLLQYLSSLVSNNPRNKRSGGGLHKSKHRSHSVPHFNQLKTNERQQTQQEPNEQDEQPDQQEDPTTASGVDDQSDQQADEQSVTSEQQQQQDSASLDTRSISSMTGGGVGGSVGGSDCNNDNTTAVSSAVDFISQPLISPIGDENITDDEKRRLNLATTSSGSSSLLSAASQSRQNGAVFESLLKFLNVQEYDELCALIALSFFYTLVNNPGLPSKFSDLVKVKLNKNTNEVLNSYDEHLMTKLIGIISKSVESDFKVRLSTLDITIKLIKTIAIVNNKSFITDFHLACIEQAREQSSFILRRHFKSEEMFLDMFEHEYNELNLTQNHHQLDSMLRDWSILLAPTSTPLSGIEFTRRFPCGDTERLKQTIRTFFLLRSLCLSLSGEMVDNQLPLTKQEHLVKENNALDLNSSDLIACTVNLKDKKDRRFLVIDPIQFILVEPEVKRIGWGIVKFSDLIQDVEVSPDKEDSRSLNITIKKTNLNGKPEVVLNSVFTFDDHIRCMAAKQHLIRARDRARRIKLEKIAQLLDISSCAANNNNSCKSSSILSSPSSSADILSYNLVAGFSMFNTFNHPGRASMVNSTWSQLAPPSSSSEKLTPHSSPLVRAVPNSSAPVLRQPQSSASPQQPSHHPSLQLQGPPLLLHHNPSSPSFTTSTATTMKTTPTSAPLTPPVLHPVISTDAKLATVFTSGDSLSSLSTAEVPSPPPMPTTLTSTNNTSLLDTDNIFAAYPVASTSTTNNNSDFFEANKPTQFNLIEPATTSASDLSLNSPPPPTPPPSQQPLKQKSPGKGEEFIA